ncbi:EcsC family protein [Sodalis sp. dw_96]|uniref:EcsC family protein n=1 Tax=Sodalis sp. dw_96 TaxID=2719794 RepID=UPI0021067E5E|nr:EcsC family protein [Sodalis sp. dw_96]
MLNIINKPLDLLGDAILHTPGIGRVLQGVICALSGVCNDIAQLSVRPQAILEEFRHDGWHGVECLGDIGALPLASIDKTVGCLAAKYKGLALAEGMGAGLAGIAGLALDIPSLITLNLRAVGEYATYYGFDIHQQEEKLFALQIIGLVSSPTDAAKNIAMAQLMAIAGDVAKKRTWHQLEKHALVKIIQEIAKTLGIRLTKAKLAQTLPIVGAAVGGGYNVYFTTRVCDAAYYLYRERFLSLKFRPRIIAVAVRPAERLQGPAGELALVNYSPADPCDRAFRPDRALCQQAPLLISRG